MKQFETLTVKLRDMNKQFLFRREFIDIREAGHIGQWTVASGEPVSPRLPVCMPIRHQAPVNARFCFHYNRNAVTVDTFDCGIEDATDTIEFATAEECEEFLKQFRFALLWYGDKVRMAENDKKLSVDRFGRRPDMDWFDTAKDQSEFVVFSDGLVRVHKSPCYIPEFGENYVTALWPDTEWVMETPGNKIFYHYASPGLTCSPIRNKRHTHVLTYTRPELLSEMNTSSADLRVLMAVLEEVIRP